MSCNCNKKVRCVETVTPTATTVNLTISDSTDIGSLEEFCLRVSKRVKNLVTGVPVPVNITINGTPRNVFNKYHLPLLSNKVPKWSVGAYVVPTTGDPFIQLFDTPCCKCNAQ